MNVFIAVKAKPFNQVQPSVIKDTTVQPPAIQKTVKKTGSHMSRTRGKVGLVVTKLTVSGSQRIKSVCHTLKLAGMQERKGQMAHTLSKNGRSLKRYTVMFVLFAKNISRLLKTMLCHYLKVVQTTSQIFSRYVETVTVRSGQSFNIYENPELLETEVGE